MSILWLKFSIHDFWDEEQDVAGIHPEAKILSYGRRGMQELRRIMVIGSPGAGKSWFSRRLGAVTGIEVFHLDRLFWKPGWTETPRDEWIALQERLVQKESWIIDGYYGATVDIRIRAADTVMFLDFPRTVCVRRAVLRMLLHYGKTRSDMGKECKERIDREFFRYIWNFPTLQRPKILRKLEWAQDLVAQVITFETSRKAKTYLGALSMKVH